MAKLAHPVTDPVGLPNFSKVPAATLAFWVLKLVATTVGEVGGNLMSMNLGLGYLQSTIILVAVFVALTAVQVTRRQFNSQLYWATIVASTTAGTTLADFADRSLGIGYTGGSLLLFTLVIASLVGWKLDTGRLSSDVIAKRSTEIHYWLTITFSQTLGTALGDWFADTAGFGYAGSTIVFGMALLMIAALYWSKRVNSVLLFWAAFIVTRPFGAVFGNLFDKPIASGGYGVNRFALTGFLIGLLFVALLVIPQKPKLATSNAVR